jgi:hypothetical protein
MKRSALPLCVGIRSCAAVLQADLAPGVGEPIGLVARVVIGQHAADADTKPFVQDPTSPRSAGSGRPKRSGRSRTAIA